MKSVKSEHNKLYKKAQAYNKRQMIYACSTVSISFIVTEILIHIPMFRIENPLFTKFYMVISLIEILSYITLTYLLDSGNRLYRYLYWIAFFVSATIILYPLTSIIKYITTSVPYIGLTVLLGIKIWILWKIGQYLQHNPNAQFVYDQVLFVDEIQNEKVIKTPILQEKKEATITKTMPTIRQGNDGIPVYYEDASYTKLATRLAGVIYGSLMIFPIIIQLLHKWFVSFDYTSNFALGGMFMACIISSLTWTIPIFYMYYNQPQSKRIVRICWFIEGMRMLYYGKTLFDYFQMDYYPITAFILFIILDGVRYYAMFRFSNPIFQMEVPISMDEED